MAQKKEGGGIQQAAGLIRYFDEESEDALTITKGQVYFACIFVSIILYLMAPYDAHLCEQGTISCWRQYGVIGWIFERVGQLFS